MTLVIIKDKENDQICTINFPIFCNSTESRKLLKMISNVYLRTEEPGTDKAGFEQVERTSTNVIYTIVTEKQTIIMLSSIKLTNKEIEIAGNLILKNIEADKSQFFITKY